MKKLLIPLFALVLAGAGCPFGGSTDVKTGTETPAPAVPAKTGTKTDTKTETKTEVKTDTETEVKTEPAPSEGTRVLTPATTDDTWKTYTNAALKFSFQTPTKGRYAPEWEVKVQSDAGMNMPCYSLPNSSLTTGFGGIKTTDGKSFCLTRSQEGEVGPLHFTDAYTTVIGHSIVTILFTKTGYPHYSGDTEGGLGEYLGISTSSSTFTLFDEAAYHATLDGIVGTFKIAE